MCILLRSTGSLNQLQVLGHTLFTLGFILVSLCFRVFEFNYLGCCLSLFKQRVLRYRTPKLKITDVRECYGNQGIKPPDFPRANSWNYLNDLILIIHKFIFWCALCLALIKAFMVKREALIRF